ncbi:DUF2213 domain-containing protein [Pandoraea sp. XJJ-1]|uniref:DUF2213 domain-containing protein n=1 Tax=Pandoraea sp. XJJ-1 TaxID=3002643 RepID=UPI00227E5817|nr:DUF2213 domain-containing protein [Pandoraea sp. XJJ-1]WAL80964.1 DUF2213 domain-containing protein [Pandoraea sp. XJJ-1]
MAMRFYTVQNLGPKRSLTPEGFLLCEDVPVARTGEMLYASGEVPVEAGLDGLIRISRTPDEVFRDATMASCMGKDITLDHPGDFVEPANYSGLTQGVMLNPRRSASEPDLLVADLLIKRPDAIKAVQDEEIEEVSLGYEADYEQVSPGRGVQRNIVVNHVAIVPRGRCGPRCAIGDKEPEMKTKDSKPKKRTWLDRVRTAFKAQDAEALEEALEEGQTADEDEPETEEERKKREAEEKDGKTGDALGQILRRLKAMDADIQELKKAAAEDDDEDDGSQTGDEGDLTNPVPAKKTSEEGVELFTGDSAAHIMARAEILSPGIKLPTLDAKMNTKDRAAALCKCQRKALDNAYQTEAGKAAIDPFLAGRTADFDAMPMASVHATFTGAAELMKARNNGGSGTGKVATRDFGTRKSVADINAANRKFWDRQGSAS